MQITNELRDFLIKNKFIKSSKDLQDEDSLLEKGIVDSAGMLELVSFIEARYSIKIDDDELMPENLDSLKAIENFINSKI